MRKLVARNAEQSFPRHAGKSVALFLCGIAAGGLFSAWMVWNAVAILSTETESLARAEEIVARSVAASLAVPKQRASPPVVNGLYMTSWSLAEKRRREELVGIVERTRVNALVIDVKDWRGTVPYETQVVLARELGLFELRVRDLPEFLAELRAREIWAIARLPVFQDTALAEAKPVLAVKSRRTGGVWRDRKGLAWVDPASEAVWEYNVALAREALEMGFDEIQFDYIRFPSDGKLSDMQYPVWAGIAPKHETIASFFKYLREQLGERAVLSVDLFGMTMLKIDAPEDDLGIGQRIMDAVPYFDYISPMVYPSHYPPGFEGFKNPAVKPYEVVAASLAAGTPAFEGKRAKLRPWLQDFHLGARYTADMVRAQIRAAEEAGSEGWLLWNAGNRYTEAALIP